MDEYTGLIDQDIFARPLIVGQYHFDDLADKVSVYVMQDEGIHHRDLYLHFWIDKGGVHRRTTFTESRTYVLVIPGYPDHGYFVEATHAALGAPFASFKHIDPDDAHAARVKEFKVAHMILSRGRS